MSERHGSGGGLAAILLALLAAAAPAPGVRAQDGTAAAEAAVDPFRFTSDAAIILWQIRQDKAADFELVWRVIRERAGTSGNPDLQALMADLRMYRLDVVEGDAFTFVFHVDPIARGKSYSPTYLLFESGLFERAEADELFELMSAALAGDAPISTMPLSAAVQVP